MESQHLAIESFSRSWLTSVSSPFEEPLRDSSHEELDYKILKSKRSSEDVHNFNFDVPISKYTETLVHADQLFSDGLIKPVFINQSKIEASDLVPVPTTCSSSTTVLVQTSHIFNRLKKTSERILQKFFGYLKPFCHKITGARVDDSDIRARQVKRWNNLPQQVSPCMPYSTNKSCDIESSIYEAVLHCKRSIDK